MIDQSLAMQMITQCCSARHRKFVLGNLHGSRKDRVEEGAVQQAIINRETRCSISAAAARAPRSRREQVKAA